MKRIFPRLPFACLGLLLMAGCSDQPKPPPRFHLDPQQAAQAAMDLYDKNGDGTLDAQELKASPPLVELLKNLQKWEPGHPESLTRDDLAARFKAWNEDTSTLFNVTPTVNLDGKPIEGATVTYDPEPFLGPSFHAHEGTTNAAGLALLKPELSGFPGIYVGLYRVSISKMVNGKEMIPAKYNANTELGREVANKIRDPRSNDLFTLKSK
jgi:hypothetical protein